jgi:hypothetical protein
MSTKVKIGIVVSLVVFAALMRLLPHQWNFTPVFAAGLFASAYFGFRAGLVVPVAAMLLADLFLGFYRTPILIAVYGSLLLAASLGWFVRKYGSRCTIAAASIVGSVLFYLVTNAAVWYWGSMYSKTFSGLLLSYEMGLPFFRNALLGDLFYSAVFFGTAELVVWYSRRGRNHSFSRFAKANS